MMTHEQVSINKFAFYVSRLDWIALCVVGVIDIWTRNGLDLAKILLLQGIFGLFVLLLEYPSGVLADLTQRKYLLVASYVMSILGVLTYLVATNFVWFVIAEFFFAMGLAGPSGADEAHVYDTYLEKGRNRRDLAEEVLATGKSLRFAGIIFMMVAGGLLTSLQWQFPFYVAAVGYLLTIVMYLRTYEPERIKVESGSAAMKISLAYLRSPRILQLALFMIIINVYLRVSFWDYLPRMDLLGVDTVWFGVVLAGCNAVAFLTSLAVRRWRRLLDYEYIMLIVAVLGLVLFMNQRSLVVVLLAISLHQIYRGGNSVFYSIKLNELVSSEVRASMMSLISSIFQGTYFLLVVVMNLIQLSSVAIHQLNALMGVLTAGLILLLKLVEHRQDVLNAKQTVATLAD